MRKFSLTLLAAFSLTAYGATAEFPYTPGLDIQALDTAADPCVDFYQYACGGWMKNNPIPADQANWDVYSKLAEDNQKFLHGMLTELASGGSERTITQQKAGDYFAACMDEGAVEQRGMTPLADHLQRIDGLRSKTELPALLAELHLATNDSGVFLGFGSAQDFADSSQVIAFAGSGGLGLPDRDYYFRRDAKSRQLRDQYRSHIARMFELIGETAVNASHAAANVLRMETALAAATLTVVQKRDPYQLFHKMPLRGLQALTPQFNWNAYLSTLGLQGLLQLKHVNVTEPKFYKAFAKQLNQSSLDEIKTYLRWHLVRSFAPALSAPFVNENFSFFSKTLLGVQALPPRWKQCVMFADAQLGEAVGEEFVRRTFKPETKANVLRMTLQVEQAMQQDIESLSWMSPATKVRAQEKLRAIVNKMGYPDRWRDYSAFAVFRDDFAGNVARGHRFELRRQLAKIGQPLDRGEWEMTPPTVNAYYNPQMNDINFPAGVLQPPLYDPLMDDAPNYGNTGATIGHELTHAFDDEGRQFDAAGNLKDWWTSRDAQAFKQRTQCVLKQYASYTVIDDIKINSKLTLGEDVADLGGMMLAWMAWQTQKALVPAPTRDGLSPEQRFFVGNAQWACENDRPENMRANALIDPHSPNKYRVNGLVVNMPEFARAFSCKPGQPMVNEKPCRVW